MYNMLIEHKERILKRGSGKGAAEVILRRSRFVAVLENQHVMRD